MVGLTALPIAPASAMGLAMVDDRRIVVVETRMPLLEIA
jgi:hypothetical protein